MSVIETRNLQEELWDERFLLFLQYIENFHHVPAVNTEYQNVKIGRWFFNQISLNKIGRLSENRKNKLNKDFPCWEKSYAERERYVQQQIIQKWMQSGQKDSYEHPITMLLKDESSLCAALLREIYSVEEFVSRTNDRHLQEKGICLLYPGLPVSYIHLFAAIKECDVSDIIRDMLRCKNQCVSSIYMVDYENLVRNMESKYLDILSEKQRIIFSYYFGLCDAEKTYTEIGKIMGLTAESIRVNLNQGMKKLRTEAAMFHLREEKDQIISRDMSIDYIIVNNKLKALLKNMNIVSVSDLITLCDKLTRGEKVSLIGRKRSRIILDELKTKQNYIIS